VGAKNRAARVGLIDCLSGEAGRPLRQRPLRSCEILGLHGAEPRDHSGRLAKIGLEEFVVCETLKDQALHARGSS
jgi:hypothetical protein